MIYKGPAGFQRIVYIIMNILVGVLAAPSLNLLVLHAPITPAGMAQSMMLSFFVGYTVSDLIPAMAWGRKLAAKMGFRDGIGAHLISSIVLAFFMGTFILFFCALINVLTIGGMPAVIGFFVSGYPVVLAAAFTAIAIFTPLATKAGAAISGFDPTKVAADSKQ